MNIEQKVNIHNRFDIHIDNIETGEHCEINGAGFNIILDQMWTRLCGGSTYFVNIHFGTGVGTPTPERTTLFSHLGTKSAVTEETIKALPVSSWKRKIVLNPEEFVGQTITEVGIAFGSTNSNLVTHAMLKDAEGNPISFTKSDTDVVTIFATVFVTLSTPLGLHFLNFPNGNTLLNYLVSGGSFPSGAFELGQSGAIGASLAPGLLSTPTLGSSTSVTWSADTPNKKRKTNLVRFGTTIGNGHVREFIFPNVFRARLPLAGIFSGQNYTGFPLGIGDGNEKTFEIPSRNIKDGSLVVKENGVNISHSIKKNSKLNFTQSAPAVMPGNSVLSLAWHTIGTDTFLAVGSDRSDATRFTWYKLIDGMLVAQPAPAVMPGNSVRSLAWHTIGTDTFLVVGSWTIDNTRFTWYKLVDGVLVAQPAPAVMPGNRVLSLAWHTIGTDTFLAVGSWTIDNTRFTWYKLVDGVLVAQPAPAVMPGSYVQSLAWHTIGTDTFLVVGSWTTDNTRFTWYKLVDGVLVAQPAPAVMPGSYVQSLAWHTIGTDTFLVVGSDMLDATRFTWYKLIDGVLVAQPAPAVMPGNSVRSLAWHTIGTDTFLAVGSDMSDATRFTWYKLVDGVLVAQPAPAVMPGSYVQSLAWHTIGTDTFLVVGSWTTDNTRFTWYNASPITTEVTLTAANGAQITADYTVDGVHKTDQYVIDVSFAIQFGEGV